MSTATEPTWQDVIREQVETAAHELVLTDEVMLEKPWLVIAHTDTGHELIDRYATQPEAHRAAAALAVGSAEHYPEVSVSTLGDIGWGVAATVTELPPPTAPADDTEAEGVADPDDEPIADADGQTALLDRSQYDREDLAIPKLDGNSVDRIRVKFSGTVMLNRSDPEDVELYNNLILGQDTVALKVTGMCSGTGGELATAKGGPQDVVVATKTVLVKTVIRGAGA